MEKEQLIEKVNNLLIEEFEIDSEKLTPTALLKNDLEIESLDFVDIVVLVDREFGFKPKAEELKTVKTLEDFYQYIAAHIA